MSENDASGRLLSPMQRNLAASALTVLAVVVILSAVYGLFLLLKNFVDTFTDVLLPLAAAAILATLLRPIVFLFEQNLKLSRVKSIALLFALVVVIITGITAYAAPILIRQALDLIDSLPGLATSAINWAREQTPVIDEWISKETGDKPEDINSDSVKKAVSGFVAEHAATIREALLDALKTIGSASGFLLGLVAKAAAYAVAPVYLIFLLDSNRDSWKDVEHQLSFIDEKWREDILFLIRQFVDILIAFFRGQIVIGLIMSVLFALGFALVGLEFAILLGILIGLANIVPYLGTILGVTIVLPLAYFQPGGGWHLIGLCAVVFVVVQTVEDYVLRPKIMGDKTGMGPMLIIFSIFFWGTALGGILGMILAIPLTAFFLVFWRLAREKYLPKLLQGQPREDDAQAKADAAQA